MQPRQPAYSLIFAFLVMTVIMIVATSSIENTKEKLVYFNEMEGSTEALLAAESAAEQAILAMKDFNAGYSIGLTEDSFEVDENNDGVYETWGDYSVYSTAQENDTDSSGYYYTPIPGTGTAAREDDCTVRDSDHDGDFDNDEDLDHPCNWNKLMYGDSVTIPLYVSDGTETGVLTPADFASFTGWYLKVRTPCADNEGQPDEVDCTTRFTFDGDGSDSTLTEDDNDSTVVFWQLIGEDVNGDSVSLLPDDISQVSYNSRLRLSANTEIYEDALNDANTAGTYIVLESTNTSPYTELYQICTDELSTLSLQLNIVTPLIDENDNPIPYLEWQLATDASQPFGDTKAVIIGEGYHQGQSGIFYFPFVVTRSTTGESTNVYTLSN